LCHRNKELAMFKKHKHSVVWRKIQNIVGEIYMQNAAKSCSKYRNFVSKHHAQNIDFMLKHHA